MEPAAVARGYYDALDTHEYDRLRSLLAPAFVQHRPDRRFEGRDPFVQFMREERPDTETDHVVEQLFSKPDGAVAVEGRLLAADGTQITVFVDVFSIEDGAIQELRTYTGTVDRD